MTAPPRSPLPPNIYRPTGAYGVVAAGELGVEIERLADATCVAYARFLGDGHGPEVALERAAAENAPERALLKEKYTANGVVRLADEALAAHLAQAVAASEAACTADAVLWALSEWPEAAPEALLRDLVAHPPEGHRLVAIAAIHAMAETGSVAFVEDLEALLDAGRDTRLGWHSLVAITRIEGSSRAALAYATNDSMPFDEEVARGMARVFSALPSEERADVARALLASPDPLRAHAAFSAAGDHALARGVGPELLERALHLSALSPREARGVVRALERAGADGGETALRELSHAQTASPHARLLAVAKLDTDEVTGVLRDLPLDEVDDGTLLFQALRPLAHASPERAEALLRTLLADRDGARLLADACGERPAASAAPPASCLQRLLEQR